MGDDQPDEPATVFATKNELVLGYHGAQGSREPQGVPTATICYEFCELLYRFLTTVSVCLAAVVVLVAAVSVFELLCLSV